MVCRPPSTHALSFSGLGAGTTRVHADHLADRWVLRTNEGEPNFRLVEAPEKNPDRRDTWRVLVPARRLYAAAGFVVTETHTHDEFGKPEPGEISITVWLGFRPQKARVS